MNIPLKISPFDFLVKFIPGFLLTYMLSFFFNCPINHDNNHWIDYIFIFSSSYICGIILNNITEFSTKSILRENKNWILGLLKKVKKRYTIEEQQSIFSKDESTCHILGYYFDTYYYVMENNYGNSINQLESQLIFLRNSIIPAALLPFYLITKYSYAQLIPASIFILIPVIAFLIATTLNKDYILILPILVSIPRALSMVEIGPTTILILISIPVLILLMLCSIALMQEKIVLMVWENFASIKQYKKHNTTEI